MKGDEKEQRGRASPGAFIALDRGRLIDRMLWCILAAQSLAKCCAPFASPYSGNTPRGQMASIRCTDVSGPTRLERADCKSTCNQRSSLFWAFTCAPFVVSARYLLMLLRICCL